eukprot:5330628-Amphidinium_carterae.2
MAVSNHHDGGITRMDVGALSKDKTKGKRKGKGKYDQQKGKTSKGKGKHDQQKGKASKGKGKGSGKDGYCSFCWKWGHKKGECRSRAKQVAATEYDEEEDKNDEAKNLVAGVGVVSKKGSRRSV